MFIQVIQGKVKDEQVLRDALDRWNKDLLPGADGYLGTTAGVTDDDSFVAIARFESKDAAMRNSERPEQGKWWAETESSFDGPSSFIDSDDVTEWMDGGSDDAGFVQVMIGHSPDVQRLRESGDEPVEQLREMRPEIIGGTFAVFGGDGYVQTVYFTTEGQARKMEGTEPPADVRAMIEERMRLMGEVTYLDLRRPILVSAKG